MRVGRYEKPCAQSTRALVASGIAMLLWIMPQVSVAYTWTEWLHIETFQTVANGTGWYVDTGDAINPALCADTSVYSFDNENHVALILFAMATNSQIRIAVHDETCFWGKPTVQRILIRGVGS